MAFLSWEQEIQKHGRDLPHWQQGAGTQFVTFRLKDSLPLVKVRQWRDEKRRWLMEYPPPWDTATAAEYRRIFTARIERWLDQGMGRCLLREPEPRGALEEVVMRFHGTRVRHHAWVIMPNHIHLLFTTEARIEQLVQAWKGHSARRIGRGPIWQPNFRDTMIRNVEHFTNSLRYIRNNPVKARLAEGEYSFWEEGVEEDRGNSRQGET